MVKIKNAQPSAQKLISLTEAAKFCNYSQEYLSLRARSKKLKSVKVGRNWMTTTEWLDEYIKKAGDYKANLEVAAVKSVLVGEKPKEAPVAVVAPVSAEKKKIAVAKAKVIKTIVKKEKAPEKMPEKAAIPAVAPEAVASEVKVPEKEAVPPKNLPIEEKAPAEITLPNMGKLIEGLQFGISYCLAVLAVICVAIFGISSFFSVCQDTADYSSLFMAGAKGIASNFSEPASQIASSFSADADTAFKQYLFYLDLSANSLINSACLVPELIVSPVKESFSAILSDLGPMGLQAGFITSDSISIIKYDISVFGDYLNWLASIPSQAFNFLYSN